MNNQFNSAIHSLQVGMMSDHYAVNPKTNPIACKLNKMKPAQLEYVTQQYSIFPRHIISFLLGAREKAKSQGWNAIEEELTRNVGEELGTQTEGKTHYKVLADGLKQEMNLKILQAKPSKATETFIHEMKTNLSKSPAFAMGAIYACECTAVPELIIVKRLVNQLCVQKNGKEMSKLGKLDGFFKMHLETWEPGHRDELKKACQSYFTSKKDIEQFEEGFEAVMKTMDTWWNELDREAR